MRQMAGVVVVLLGTMALAGSALAVTCSCTAPDGSCSTSVTCPDGCYAICATGGRCISGCSNPPEDPPDALAVEEITGPFSICVRNLSGREVSALVERHFGQTIQLPETLNLSFSFDSIDFAYLDAFLAFTAKYSGQSAE